MPAFLYDIPAFLSLVLMTGMSWLMLLIPIVMAVYSFRLWRATAIRGCAEMTIGFGTFSLVALISRGVSAEIGHVVMNDGASIPDWFQLFG